MKKQMKSIISLTVICAVIAMLLGVTNFITAPIVEENQKAAENEALLVVYPEGEAFESVDITQYELPATVTEAYSETNGGYVIKLTTSGYGAGMVIMCGVNNDGVVTGATCLESSETLSYEKTYGEYLTGVDIDTVESVDLVAGATMTTTAYRNAVKDALNSVIILNGGEVDIRSEEEILSDNLNLALPEADGKFTSKFITEDLTDISAVYEADNGTGYVFVSGENYVATDKEGNVTSETDTELVNLIESQAKDFLAVTLEEIDISGYDSMPAHIQAAYKTSSGNYVFDLRAAGYGINGDAYSRSDEYIYIKAAVTADGTIISCQTVSQAETSGIGSGCGDEAFYKQFNGKTKEDYSQVDAISGATITTNGYKTAISKVFEAVEILKGVS